MNRTTTCLLLSGDAAWAERISRSLPASIAMRVFNSWRPLESTLERQCAQVLLLDLRGDNIQELLESIHTQWPSTVIIAFGAPGSTPFLAAEEADIFAVEDLDAERRHLVAVVQRALAFLQLQQENRMLRMEVERSSRDTALTKAAATRLEPADGPAVARHFPLSLHKFDDVDAMLENLAEGVAEILMVARVGIFCRSRDSETYRLRASLRCLDDSRELTYEPGDALVSWLERHAHMVYRPLLDHIGAVDARLMLLQTLDVLGAEIIIPLHTRDRLLGWMCVGHRVTGLPFERPQLERLMLIAEQVSTTLENAILYEELTVQKTLAETLLQSLPVGIVAVDAEGIVRWYSAATASILGLPSASAMQRPVEKLGSRLADAVRRSLLGEPPPAHPAMWTDPRSKKTIAVLALRLTDRDVCLGSVALLQDMTAQLALKAKEEQMERKVFWTELAASMSHEIRNPLVAIKTFAQLLPERYHEEEFRHEFSQLVSSEVDRLNSIITRISEFAHPPELKFAAMDVRAAIQKSVDEILPPPDHCGLQVELQVAPELAPLWGDRRALVEALGYLLVNASEALARRTDGHITITARPASGVTVEPHIEITIADNGAGIPPDIRDRVFSPFCTTKPRGLGLGLSIVKRTVVDHNGHINVESSAKGTAVTLILPAATSDHHQQEAALESETAAPVSVA